ncbi:hypothetical protein LINPERHAP1_LOCUS19263 [Linum perenne]
MIGQTIRVIVLLFFALEATTQDCVLRLTS